LGRNLTTRQIIQYLCDVRTPTTTHDIAKAINKTEITVQRKLTRLAQAHIVLIVDEGLIAKYKLNKEKSDALNTLLGMRKRT
jgi:predicted transcriptional regulator